MQGNVISFRITLQVLTLKLKCNGALKQKFINPNSNESYTFYLRLLPNLLKYIDIRVIGLYLITWQELMDIVECSKLSASLEIQVCEF